MSMAMLTANGAQSARSFDAILTIKDADQETAGFVLVYGPSRAWEHPQLGMHWEGHEVRFDDQGRKWVRQIDRLVVDNFGALVEVPA